MFKNKNANIYLARIGYRKILSPYYLTRAKDRKKVCTFSLGSDYELAKRKESLIREVWMACYSSGYYIWKIHYAHILLETNLITKEKYDQLVEFVF